MSDGQEGFGHRLGTLDVGPALAGAPHVALSGDDELVLEGVRTLQVLFETEASTAEAVLPLALHPSIPPHLSWIVRHCPDSPAGAFRLAETRIGCRSGTKPRGYLVGAVIDNPVAGDLLAARWGFRCQTGEVRLDIGFDRMTARVVLDGQVILDLSLVDPEVVAGGSVKYVPNLNPARTELGLQLVQVDADYAFERIERGRPRLDSFAPAAWGEPRLRPTLPVSATLTTTTTTLHRLAWACDPHRPAREGTVQLQGVER
ncbi:MAG: hypothetical protein ACRD0O_07390 [Acidimicrobiia bacterium]